MLGDNVVGPMPLQDGALPIGRRMDRTGCTVVGDGHGHFREAVYRGNCYVATNAVAGVAPGTALATTPPLAIWNPPGSGVNADIWKIVAGYVSGTLGAGGYVYAQNPQLTKPTGGTQLFPVSCLLGKGSGGAIQAFTGSTLAATPTLVRPCSINMDAMLASTATSGFNWADLVDGEMLLQPGTAFSIQGLCAAGSTPLICLAITYEETLV